MIFNKADRELARRSIDPVFHSFIDPIGLDYIKALEEVAKAAGKVHQPYSMENLFPTSDLQSLLNSLQKVDWMRE